jgi:general secretion pathway protein H
MRDRVNRGSRLDDVKKCMTNKVSKLSASDGFTLLELMIVLFIAMLMMGMGIIAMMGRLPAAKLDATAREMSAMMRQARTLAKIQGEKQAIVVDLSARTYGIEGKTSRKIPEEIQLTIDDFLTGGADNGIYRLVFSPFGGSDGGTVLLSTDKRSISIKPDPVVGFLITRKKRD